MRLAAHDSESRRWTFGYVKLLLPPRQSRGNSYIGLDSPLRYWRQPEPFAPMFLIILSFVVLNACIAAWCGDLSWDSWVYLGIADSIKSTGLPTFAGHYLSNRPVGYPVLLALTSPHAPFIWTIVSSKFANAALAVLGYFSLRRIGAATVAAGLTLLNPLFFYFLSMTLSEMMFVASVLLLVYGMHQYHERQKARFLVIVIGAAVLGFESRYAFGFLLPIVGVLYVAAFGYRSRLPLLFALAAAMALFGAQFLTNVILTGNAAGDRAASDTSAALQMYYLVRASVYCAISAGAWVLCAIALGVRPQPSRWPIFIALIAVGYLLLMLLLRSLYEFDNLNVRLVGPAWILLAAAFAVAVRPEAIRLPRHWLVLSLVLAGTGSAILGHSSYASGPAAIVSTLRHLPTTSAVAAVHDYLTQGSAWQNYKALIYLDIPEVPGHPLQPHVYIAFDGVPSFTPSDFRTQGQSETLAEFIERTGIEQMRREDCVVVFTPYDSRADLDRTLDRTFRVTLDENKDLYAPDIRQAFARIFMPRSLVPCLELVATARIENEPSGEDRPRSPD